MGLAMAAMAVPKVVVMAIAIPKVMATGISMVNMMAMTSLAMALKPIMVKTGSDDLKDLPNVTMMKRQLRGRGAGNTDRAYELTQTTGCTSKAACSHANTYYATCHSTAREEESETAVWPLRRGSKGVGATLITTNL